MKFAEGGGEGEGEVIALPTSHCNARSKSNSIANCRRVAKVVRDSAAATGHNNESIVYPWNDDEKMWKSLSCRGDACSIFDVDNRG